MLTSIFKQHTTCWGLASLSWVFWQKTCCYHLSLYKNPQLAQVQIAQSLVFIYICIIMLKNDNYVKMYVFLFQEVTGQNDDFLALQRTRRQLCGQWTKQSWIAPQCIPTLTLIRSEADWAGNRKWTLESFNEGKQSSGE